MKDQVPHWLTHLVVGDEIRNGGTLFARDPMAMPFLAGDASAKVVPVKFTRHIHVAGQTARALIEQQLPDRVDPDAGPFVVIADDLEQQDLKQIADLLGGAPDIVIRNGDGPHAPGLQAASRRLPGLYIAPGAEAILERMEQRAADSLGGKVDAFDLIQNLCDQHRPLRRLIFDVGGDALLELAPLPLIRGLTKAAAAGPLVHGSALQQRWSPIRLRIPVLGLERADVHVRARSISAIAEMSVAIAEHHSTPKSATLTARRVETVRTKARAYQRATTDLLVSGNNIEIDAVLVRLPALHSQIDADFSDPLDRFARPLSEYG